MAKKYQTTQKAIRESFPVILSVGYCKAQYLFDDGDAFAYSAGVYGWNCDYFQVGGVCVATGYRPHGKHVPYDIAKKYDDLAAKAREIFRGDYDEYKREIDGLRVAFVREALEVLKK